jgi:hypothetical protein
MVRGIPESPPSLINNIYQYVIMNSVILDVSVAAASLVVLIIAIFALPMILPAGYAILLALILFIACMSGGGYLISNTYKAE